MFTVAVYNKKTVLFLCFFRSTQRLWFFLMWYVFSLAYLYFIGAPTIVRGRREDDVFDISREPVDAITVQAGQSQAKDSQDTLQGESPFTQPIKSHPASHICQPVRPVSQSDHSALSTYQMNRPNRSVSPAEQSVSQTNQANRITPSANQTHSASEITQPIKSLS